MKIIETRLESVFIIEPTIYEDQRGFFYESWNYRVLEELGIKENFVQDNHSYSKKNVLRGLHYQLKNPQGKLVRVTSGMVQDVVVDLRAKSYTFGEYISVNLSSANKRQIWIPPGFAHGFLTLSDSAEFLYKTTDYYNFNDERTIIWDDNFLNIEWQLQGSSPFLSSKDSNGKSFKKSEIFR